MDLFKAAISTGIQYVSNSNKQQKLRSQLYHCTYPDDAKFVIEKAVKQVLHVYPHFQTQILQFSQSGKQKRYIQIKGIMEVEVRGKICKVDYNMMIPSNFPRKAPYVRIINRSNQYQVNDFYKALRSPTDPKSFILNQKLNEVKTWNQTKSISHNLMRNNFPFAKGGSSSQMNSGWQQSPWQQQNQQQNYNQGGNNNAFNNLMGGIGGMGGISKSPPIPFNSGPSSNKQPVQQVIANHQKFIGSSKKIIQKLKQQHIGAIQKIQHLQTIKYSLASEQQYLRSQNYKMNQFLRNSDTSRIQDLSSLINTADDRSQQILDLASSLKARDQCISLLQGKFNDGEMGFEQFIKLVRKIQEQKFQQKVLLAKCINA